MPRRRDKHFLDATCGGVSGKDRLIPDGQLSNTDAAPGSGGPGPACPETLVFSRPGSPQFSGPGPTPHPGQKPCRQHREADDPSHGRRQLLAGARPQSPRSCHWRGRQGARGHCGAQSPSAKPSLPSLSPRLSMAKLLLPPGDSRPLSLYLALSPAWDTLAPLRRVSYPEFWGAPRSLWRGLCNPCSLAVHITEALTHHRLRLPAPRKSPTSSPAYEYHPEE
ncbi:uncharacterized protein LOC107512382 [Rousettus aegyptiacus]|uniref:uncharacterized protein LOC107512382 n=1 Tax=Rousettus aegyptiacus TaxID=9407 RepID=UPI00168CAD94|nr:uncharacterized protein LOC107512382 [Rousettus aegyptiacus]